MCKLIKGWSENRSENQDTTKDTTSDGTWVEKGHEPKQNTSGNVNKHMTTQKRALLCLAIRSDRSRHSKGAVRATLRHSPHIPPQCLSNTKKKKKKTSGAWQGTSLPKPRFPVVAKKISATATPWAWGPTACQNKIGSVVGILSKGHQCVGMSWGV